ncbi:MAG: outer membrane lipoprotein-sorting protein [Gammaproteobacteria bacterium]|nr:outer membrane lipoprotein-sorting protein [Gammaproteobacteria bacterium]
MLPVLLLTGQDIEYGDVVVKISIIPYRMVAVLLLIFPVFAVASDVATEIEACIKKNAPASTAIQHIQLRSEGLMSEEDVLEATVYWKLNADGNSNLLAVFEQPIDISGSKLLFLEKKPEKEIYLYMPGLFKMRRITSSRISSSMYGMDFSYEDFQWLYNMLTISGYQQRPEVVIDGESMYVLAVVPADASSSKYEEVITFLDKQSCVVRKVEFYEAGGKLRKELSAVPASVKQVDGLKIPHAFLMRDIKDYSETELFVIAVQIDPAIPDSVFDPRLLKDFHGLE